jgi:hypothetical protein
VHCHRSIVIFIWRTYKGWRPKLLVPLIVAECSAYSNQFQLMKKVKNEIKKQSHVRKSNHFPCCSETSSIYDVFLTFEEIHNNSCWLLVYIFLHWLFDHCSKDLLSCLLLLFSSCYIVVIPRKQLINLINIYRMRNESDN